MIRLFVALNIPDSAKEDLINFRNQAYKGNEIFKWEPKDKLHITLKFIGEVNEDLVPKLSDELSFLTNYKKISCSFENFGFFFVKNVPRILWAGFKTDPVILSIVSKLNSNLEKFSIPTDKRKFKSHITLLRLKGDPGKIFIDSFKKFKFPPSGFFANEIVLYKSELLSKGSVYKEIKKFNLK